MPPCYHSGGLPWFCNRHVHGLQGSWIMDKLGLWIMAWKIIVHMGAHDGRRRVCVICIVAVGNRTS